MPIEIREVVVKLVVEDQDGDKKTAQGGSGNGENNTSQQQMLVNICVKKVLEILKDKRGR